MARIPSVNEYVKLLKKPELSPNYSQNPDKRLGTVDAGYNRAALTIPVLLDGEDVTVNLPATADAAPGDRVTVEKFGNQWVVTGSLNTPSRGIIYWGRRTSSKVFTTSETAVMRLDNVFMRQGWAYNIVVPRVRFDFVTATDRGKAVIRYTNSGTATTSSSLLARTESGDVQTAGFSGLLFPPSTGTYSFLLSAIQYSGSSTATFIGTDEGGIDMYVEGLGPAPSNTTVNL
jgi:hypothetical protein